jgi:hypothetical protein
MPIATPDAPDPVPARNWSLFVELVECPDLGVVRLPCGELTVRCQMQSGAHAVTNSSTSAAAAEGAPLFSLLEVLTSLWQALLRRRGRRQTV